MEPSRKILVSFLHPSIRHSLRLLPQDMSKDEKLEYAVEMEKSGHSIYEAAKATNVHHFALSRWAIFIQPLFDTFLLLFFLLYISPWFSPGRCLKAIEKKPLKAVHDVIAEQAAHRPHKISLAVVKEVQKEMKKRDLQQNSCTAEDLKLLLLEKMRDEAKHTTGIPDAVVLTLREIIYKICKKKSLLWKWHIQRCRMSDDGSLD